MSSRSWFINAGIQEILVQKKYWLLTISRTTRASCNAPGDATAGRTVTVVTENPLPRRQVGTCTSLEFLTILSFYTYFWVNGHARTLYHLIDRLDTITTNTVTVAGRSQVTTQFSGFICLFYVCSWRVPAVRTKVGILIILMCFHVWDRIDKASTPRGTKERGPPTAQSPLGPRRRS